MAEWNSQPTLEEQIIDIVICIPVDQWQIDTDPNVFYTNYKDKKIGLRQPDGHPCYIEIDKQCFNSVKIQFLKERIIEFRKSKDEVDKNDTVKNILKRLRS